MQDEDLVRKAVDAGILAAAHAATLERVGLAEDACARLGALSSGRWRAAARELAELEESLERSLQDLVEDVRRKGAAADVPEETLWTLGEAAWTYDTLSEDALDEIDEGTAAEKVLDGDLLYGVAFLDSPEKTEDSGLTLLFHWSEPLSPAVWAWDATWIETGQDAENGQGGAEELDLADAAEIQIPALLLAAATGVLESDELTARDALKTIARALTRAWLLPTDEEDQGDEEGEEDK